MTTKIQISSEAAEFAKMVGYGVESWRKAGKIIAKNYHRDPTFLRQCEQASGLSEHTVKFFIRIGQGTLNPRLLLRDSSPGVKRALSLPIGEQVRLESEAVEVVMGDTTQKLSIFEMDRFQARMAIGPNGIRTPAQQRQFLFTQKRTTNRAWYVSGERVVFTRGAVLSAREIETILAELAKP